MSKSRRFDYVQYDDEGQQRQGEIKSGCTELERLLDKLKDGRYKALAFTHLEIAYAMAGKAIRDEVIARNPDTPDLNRRTDE